MKKFAPLFSIGIMTFFFLAVGAMPFHALADRPEGKIRICHATDSHTNQYTENDVDQDAIDGDAGNDNGQGDHYLEHNGPIWFDGIADHSWGDIIPPIDGVHEGKNWTEEGQRVHGNSCSFALTVDPTPTATPSATPTATPSATPTLDPTPTPTPGQSTNDNRGGDVLGATTEAAKEEPKGDVLGATTYAATGVAEDIAMNIAGIFGLFSMGAGLLYGKKAS